MNRRQLAYCLGAVAPVTLRSASDPNDWLGPGTLTNVPGIKVGHFTLKARPTGCTVVLCENGATGGVDVRGAAPGTRDTELLNPVNSIQHVHAIMLSGGSAYGLETAAGAMRYLESQRRGFKIAGGVVPIVPAAILMDLAVGDFKIRPDAEAGYQACLSASTRPVEQGCVGAGAGATVGKLFGMKVAMKAGIGSASVKVGNTGIVVAALVAVNAVGDVVHPKTGRILAGARAENGRDFRDTLAQMMQGLAAVPDQAANTTLGVVATNATLDKAQVTKIAQMAHDGFARSINPIHTSADGDTIFGLATGASTVKVNAGMLGAVAAEVIAQAVVRAAVHATTVLGIPGLKDWKRE